MICVDLFHWDVPRTCQRRSAVRVLCILIGHTSGVDSALGSVAASWPTGLWRRVQDPREHTWTKSLWSLYTAAKLMQENVNFNFGKSRWSSRCWSSTTSTRPSKNSVTLPSCMPPEPPTTSDNRAWNEGVDRPAAITTHTHLPQGRPAFR